jgi:diguanylate cyclase (GGDEF)-like protein
MEEQLSHLANTDMLTGAFNRRAGLLLLEAQMKQANRDKTQLTIVFVDIDNLKTVNDKYGHNEGDELITAVSNGIGQVLRASDTLCRIGGDEFLIILPKCNKEQADQTWNRVVDIFDHYNKSNSKPYEICASYGFAEYPPEKEMPLDEFISLADREMYKCKQRLKK